MLLFVFFFIPYFFFFFFFLLIRWDKGQMVGGIAGRQPQRDTEVGPWALQRGQRGRHPLKAALRE